MIVFSDGFSSPLGDTSDTASALDYHQSKAIPSPPTDILAITESALAIPMPEQIADKLNIVLKTKYKKLAEEN